MSLVYNNDKPIGKCESYSIDKIPGTSPFVMLTNYEPLRSELNENQQIVFEWLKKQGKRRPIMTIADFADAYYGLECAPTVPLEILSSYEQLSDLETYQVLAAYAEWGMKEVAE